MREILTIYLIFIIAFFLVTIKDFGNAAVTPKQLYECNNFNMFAAVLLYIVVFVFDPIFFIAHFLYWIFHVGREEEN